MSPSAQLAALVADYSAVDDPHERLALLVDRAKRNPPLPPELRLDAHRVRGCISVVWLVGDLRDGLCRFRSDADSPLVRGLVALVCEVFDGCPPAAIVADDADPVAALGLLKNLSPTRRNGLASARAAIRAFAQQHA